METPTRDQQVTYPRCIVSSLNAKWSRKYKKIKHSDNQTKRKDLLEINIKEPIYLLIVNFTRSNMFL